MKTFFIKQEFFELGFNIMSDCLTLHLGWWEFSIYRSKGF